MIYLVKIRQKIPSKYNNYCMPKNLYSLKGPEYLLHLDCSFSFQSVIIDMKAMLNNAIKGDYIAAESDPSVSLYEKEMSDSRK